MKKQALVLLILFAMVLSCLSTALSLGRHNRLPNDDDFLDDPLMSGYSNSDDMGGFSRPAPTKQDADKHDDVKDNSTNPSEMTPNSDNGDNNLDEIFSILQSKSCKKSTSHIKACSGDFVLSLGTFSVQVGPRCCKALKQIDNKCTKSIAAKFNVSDFLQPIVESFCEKK